MARCRTIISLLAIGFLSAIAIAQTTRAMLDNPQFESWNKYGIGSNSRLGGSMMSNGMKVAEMTLTYTLVDKGKDQVTVEVAPAVSKMGQSQQAPKSKEQISAKAESLDLKKVGTETVSAMTRSFECTVWEHTNPDPGDKSKTASGKVYLCNDVPGGVVKMDVKTPQGDIVLLLEGFEIK